MKTVRTHILGLFLRCLSFCRLFERDGRSAGRFNKVLGTGRLRLAKKSARAWLAAAWLYGLRAARFELDGRRVVESDINIDGVHRTKMLP